ncbi:polysaccharide pyruvyl transferase family protein [Bacillaceae bacterium Marseille-Q3522]|nr:polysaccharide pyruvyl transferase family protein [Bacillaceae bacterium Marseille-Q3522]
MKKKILVSAYFAQNVGDDLFLKTLFDRYANVEWELLTANRNYNHIFKAYKNVKIIYSYREIKIGKQAVNLFYAGNLLKKYHAFLLIGGSLFMQSPAWERKISEREQLVKEFKRMEKKVFLIGANFGPFHNDVYIERYRGLFQQFDDICFRDQYSRKLFHDVAGVRVAPDLVFTMKDRSRPVLQEEASVGFSLIHLQNRQGLREHHYDYIEKMSEWIRSYVEQGRQVKLFSFCEIEGDAQMNQELLAKLGDVRRRVKHIRYEGNLPSFLAEFKSCTKIIATRFHAIILALLFKQKVYPIIYSEKTLHVLQDLKLEKYACDIKQIHSLDVKQAMNHIEENTLENGEVINMAERHFEKLDTFVLE